MTIFAATFKLKLPRITGTISPAFVLVLVSIATLSLSATIIIGAVSGLVQCCWKPQRRPSLLQLLFSVATMTLAGGMAHFMTQYVILTTGPDSIVVSLAIAGVTLLVANTLIVTTIIRLTHEALFIDVWRTIQLSMVPYYIAGGIVADACVNIKSDTWLPLIGIGAVSLYLLSVCCREVGRIFFAADQKTIGVRA